MDTTLKSRQLAGSGRLEVLVFGLETGVKYGINVFKVKEILKCPKIHVAPMAHPSVCGLITVREDTLSVIDLSKAIGQKAVENTEDKLVVVAEYNNTTLAFLVNYVDNILAYDWSQIKEPPSGLASSYLTAVAQQDNNMIQILDVETILNEIIKVKTEIDKDIISDVPKIDDNKYVLVVDDSSVARKQITNCLKEMNINSKTFENGRLAKEFLKSKAEDNTFSDIVLVISDIEMPEMDGYSLTRFIKEDAKLKNLHVVLHTSITGVFNKELVESVGADDFICKFNSNVLSESIIKNIKAAI
jgi:two-component system chemotaxis response regulator CheV